ncbi:type 1 glutamine amidotransferase domain-containing protein [Rhodosalinus sp.]|uniref:type 1 glutamine amidotransferase domain-containing protein n=1 Tax=Rhodosalinus sp. TaxID=2047741 RepID=UPI0035633696
MARLDGKTVAILATHGFEQSELEQPREALAQAGATVHVIAPETEDITGWNGSDWGGAMPVDRPLGLADPADYDAVVLPGGQINPDILRTKPEAVDFVRAIWAAGKPVAAICHGPWMLIEAGVATGRKMTSYPSIRTDVENAGGHWEDSEVVADAGLVTSRNPGDLPAFSERLIDEIAEGGPYARAA